MAGVPMMATSNAVMAERGIASLPGFVESVRILVEHERYCMRDVAFFFGVSRERIRQLCERHGINTAHSSRGLLSVRLWNDELHCFEPVRKTTIARAQHRQRVAENRARIRERIERRRVEMVATIRACAERLGRTPTVIEAWEAVSGKRGTQSEAAGRLASYWGARSGTSRGALPALWVACGLTPRPRGNPGFIAPRALKTHCKHGHEYTPENTMRWRNHRSCRACHNASHARSYAAKVARRRSTPSPTEAR
jgi:hypothetical protein